MVQPVEVTQQPAGDANARDDDVARPLSGATCAVAVRVSPRFARFHRPGRLIERHISVEARDREEEQATAQGFGNSVEL